MFRVVAVEGWRGSVCVQTCVCACTCMCARVLVVQEKGSYIDWNFKSGYISRQNILKPLGKEKYPC